MMKKGLSRRRFMKDGLAIAATTSLSLHAFSQSARDKKIAGVSRTSLKSLTAIPTTCLQCQAGCGIIAYLNGNRLVQILGNPDHPNNRGGICAKGIAGINLVNDPERLLYPLKRVGARGENRWSRITWDEVYLTMRNRIGHLLSEGRIRELIVDVGQKDPILLQFIRASGGASVIDRPFLNNLSKSSALDAMTGNPTVIPDVAKSRVILNFGANPFANHDYFIGLARRLALARTEQGAKLITFDVRLSETASKSDEWHPVKPGTDGSIALAMAHVIVNRGLADRVFIEQKTNVSFEALKQHLSPFTAEWAEKESGLAAEDIERLAILYASNRPSVALIGGGAFDHENGNQNTRCISLLNWLVGNLEKEGGLFFPQSAVDPMANPETSETIVHLKRKDTPIDTYFAYLANPSYGDADCVQSTALLKDESTTPFLVVMDTHMTETAMLADLVLPAATYLEGWGMESAPSLDGFPILNLRQPVVSLLSSTRTLRSPSFDAGKLLENTFLPMGEAVEVGNFCLILAKKIGGAVAKALPFRDTRDYANKRAESFSDKSADIQALMQKGWSVKTGAGRKVSTESINIAMVSPGNPERSKLPEYVPLSLRKEGNAGQFILTTFKSNLGTKGVENSKWAREILHENRLWMNKGKALQLGIKNGEKVRVRSSVGSLAVRVMTTERIHPESVALAEGLGHTAFGNVARAQEYRSKDNDTYLIWWSDEGKGVNPNSIIENRLDPVGGGLASKDTVVQVEKIEE
jgi:thiosulfate reductase/polysulfide reductase chain A